MKLAPSKDRETLLALEIRKIASDYNAGVITNRELIAAIGKIKVKPIRKGEIDGNTGLRYV